MLDQGAIDWDDFRFVLAIVRGGSVSAAAKQLAANSELPLPPNADPAELAAWTVVANVLLNLDGVLMKS